LKKLRRCYTYMRLMGYTVDGLEQIAADELDTIVDGTIDVVEDARIIIDGGEDSLYRSNYFSGTCSRFVYLLTECTASTPEEMADSIEADFSELLRDEQTFVVRVNRVGDHDFSSVDVAREVGQEIVDSYRDATGTTLDVDLEEPDVIFRLDLFDDRWYFGIDTTGEPLGSRDYFRRRKEGATPAVLASCLVRASDWSPDQSLLDPFCGSGTIPIEAGRIACNVPNAGRKFAFLDLAFADRQQYAAVAQEAKERMDLRDLRLEGSDIDPEGAEMAARASGLDIPFSERDAMDRPLDADVLLFHAPFVEQKSKRKTIASMLSDFEDRMLRSDMEAAYCITEDRSFFDQYDTEKRISFGSVDGWLLSWE